MTVVTLEEACATLVELVRRVDSGERFVIVDRGRSVAQLVSRPEFPITPEEIETAEPGRIEFIREFIRRREEEGNPLPADDPLRELVAERKSA
jgi:antitoxin (DNA-binding transcriptional repressor) of toxin-antitoxin stability system